MYRSDVLFSVLAAGNASWPMFRGGPALMGVARGSLSDSLKLYWKFRTDGAIKSSAAIQDSRVYIGSNDEKIYCLDLSNGNEIWSFQKIQ